MSVKESLFKSRDIEAVERLQEMLKDLEYRETWKANIAMAFKDEYNRYKQTNSHHINSEDIHEIANKAAEDFLKLFCDEIEYPQGR